MAKRSIVSDVDLLKGAEAIAADMQGPAGQRLKLAKVIDEHLEWFEQARRRGLEWSDIIALLFRAGATRSDGRPLLRGHVQSLVWRKQHAARQMSDEVPARGAISPAIPKRTARSRVPPNTSEPVPGGRRRQPAKQGSAAPAAALPERPEREAVGEKPGTQPQDSAVLAYMKRVRNLREEK